jgi:hypothetical protein
MARSGLLPIVLTTALAVTICAPIPAQTATNEAPLARGKVRVVPPPVQPVPFPIDASSRRPTPVIEFHSAEEMTASDRLLAANAESSIAELAGLNGFALEEGTWGYQQIVCPALPNHLFLKYKRNNGVGDVTVFSASIPRGGEGRVRIIPILRRGYSLFSPAPINALTISAFNHIRAEEAPPTSSSWLGNGLCYAALAGARPRIAPPDQEPVPHKPVAGLRATMDVPVKTGEVIKFVDDAATPKPMEWTMTFTKKGKLIKAAHFPSPMIASRPVPENSAVLKVTPVPPASED